MDANEYQYRSLTTLMRLYGTKEALVYCALGLSGEVGELVEHIKKWAFHGHGLDKRLVRDELGDVLYYVAIAAHKAGYTLDEVMEHNLEKLAARYPEGFSQEKSRNRDE